MIMRRKSFLLLFFVLSNCLPLWATTEIYVPFFCGFESSEDLGDWVLNPGTNSAQDKWVIGNATRSEGNRSLYISCDGGRTNTYGSSPNVVMAYRKIKFPTSNSAEEYDISFDVKTEGDAAYATLYVYFGYEDVYLQQGNSRYLLQYANATSATKYPQQMRSYAKSVYGSSLSSRQAIYEIDSWQSVSIEAGNGQSYSTRIPASGSKDSLVLAFVWINANMDNQQQKMGACIDNIQIARARVKKPQNLSALVSCADSAVILRWESSLSHFCIEYRSTTSTKWSVIGGINLTGQGNPQSYRLHPIKEGAYDFRIKGSLAGDTSAYVSKHNVTVYCPENHCINYIDLSGENVRCTATAKGIPFPALRDTVPIDYGSSDKMSRHTVHWDKNEYDERTDYMLRTVPDKAMASVRLGNWNTGREGESISYDYVVDKDNAAILLLKYACVLNKPGSTCGDPGFKMNIYNNRQEVVGGQCGSFDFTYSSAKNDGWNETEKGDVVWKDWTTLGLNLQEYDGDTLTIELTTWDCGGGGHYGYAYFTIDCVSASLTTDNCGDDPNISVDAPDDFTYRWYAEKDRNRMQTPRGDDAVVVSNTSALPVVRGDTNTYVCRMLYIDKEDCYFELKTRVEPRYPYPEYSYSWIAEDCESRLQFSNTSHVINISGSDTTHTTEKCQNYEWMFVNRQGRVTSSTLIDPVYECSGYGDTIAVALTALIANDSCYETRIDTIIVPTIYTPDNVVYAEACEGVPYRFGEQELTQSGRYENTFSNIAGCDSAIVLFLDVHPKSPETSFVMKMCSDDAPFVWEGTTYYDSGKYRKVLQNKWGCDSVVFVDLTIQPKLLVSIDNIPEYLCADGGGLFVNYQIDPYQIGDGTQFSKIGLYDSVIVRFSNNVETKYFYPYTIYDNAIRQFAHPFGNAVLPWSYMMHIVYYQDICGNQEFDIPFDIRYSSSVLQEKWCDAILLRNKDYNGGYSFTEYQWYKNGQPIEGATKAYLQEDEGLDPNAEYCVLLTRASDGVRQFTCPIVPDRCTDVPSVVTPDNLIPTLVTSGQIMTVHIGQPAKAYTYTSTGELHSVQVVVSGEGSLKMPYGEGCHFFRIICADGTAYAQKILITP